MCITDPFFCINTPAGHHGFWRKYKARLSAPVVPDYTVHLQGGATLPPASSHTKPSSLPQLLQDFKEDWKACFPSQPRCQWSQFLTLCPTSHQALPRAAGAAASLHLSSLHTALLSAFLVLHDMLIFVLLIAYCNPRSFS